MANVVSIGERPISEELLIEAARPRVARVAASVAQETSGMKARVQAALGRLEEKDRALVWSCICEGCQIRGVAETLGLEYDNARYRPRVALRDLGQWLKAA